VPARRSRTAAAAHARAQQVDAPVVSCPQCGLAVAWSAENRFRPFCSQRCRTLDLGAWASESYRVPEPPAPMGSDDD
jgi:endogenous inhibitor of DNA gyrase (YacG/DUF329 family)